MSKNNNRKPNMRILYLGESVQIHDFRFIEKLVEKGYDTHVLTFTSKPIKIEGATYHSFPKVKNPGNYSRWAGNVIYIGNLLNQRAFLRKLIMAIKPDIVHVGWIPEHGFITALSGFHPFLLMPWGSDVLIRPKEIFLNKYITKFVIKRADMITCDAEHVKKEIIKLSGYPAEKIIVFPQGIYLNKFNTFVDGFSIRKELGWNEKKILIITRSFLPVYGIEFFLRAIPKIIKEVPETRIILCGLPEHSNENSEKQYKEFLQNNNLTKYVYFAGFIKNDDMPKYYSAADIYVSSSLSDGSSSSLLEAMACGLPVVVTAVPAIMEWVNDGENGFVVPVKEPLIMADKIIELLKSEKLLNKFSRRNIEIAQKRADWNKNFEKLELIYRKLSNKKFYLNNQDGLNHG